MGPAPSKPPLPSQSSILTFRHIPLSIILLMEVIIAFLAGILSYTMRNNLITCAVICFTVYLWMFMIYYLFFGGTQPENVFGQVFVIFVTIFAFTVFFINIVPGAVHLFENTVGYYYVILKHYSNVSTDDNAPMDLNTYLYVMFDQTDVNNRFLANDGTSCLYKITENVGKFNNNVEIKGNIVDPQILINIVNEKYNIGVICWMIIASVISTFLSMEYMSAYI